MRIWLVRAESFDYDEYDAFVVIAEDEAGAVKQTRASFNKGQGEITATEVPLDNGPGIILGSFNAG